jgi:hypothetical protein
MHKYIHQIEEMRQAIFVGFFGPIGVSAIFYLYISVEFLDGITVDGVQREDAKQVSEILTLVVWFLAICSIVSLPLIVDQCTHTNTLTGRPRPQHPSGQARFLPPTNAVKGIHIASRDQRSVFPRTISRPFAGRHTQSQEEEHLPLVPLHSLHGAHPSAKRRRSSRRHVRIGDPGERRAAFHAPDAACRS